MSGAETTVWKIRDESGRLVAEHVRQETPDGKQVRWRRPDGRWGLDGTPLSDLPLYGAHDVGSYYPDELIAVVEGEKCRDALADLRIACVASVTGAGATPSRESLSLLEGRRVILWPDNDDQGAGHMERVGAILSELAAEVLIFEWPDAPPKGDAFDYVETYAPDANKLERLLEGAPAWKPKEDHGSGLHGRVLIGQRITEGAEPPAQLVPGFLYEGKIHDLKSEPGEGKTILALYAALEVTRQGRPVLYLDSENGPPLIAERLEDMGADPSELDDYLHYYLHPEISLADDALSAFMETVRAVGPALAVFDSLADFLAISGLDENGAGDVTKWIVGILQPLRDMGVATLILDHVTKAADGRGRYARGSGAKLAKVDASWSLTQTVPFDRQRVGEIQLTLRKDREAFLPKRQRFAVGGTGDGLMVRRSAGMHETTEEDELPDGARIALVVLRDRFPNGAKHGEWKEASGLTKTTFGRSAKTLLSKGLVENRRQRYHPKPTVEGPPPNGPKMDPETGATDPNDLFADTTESTCKTEGPQGPRTQNGPNGPNAEGPQGPPPYRVDPMDPAKVAGPEGAVGEKNDRRLSEQEAHEMQRLISQGMSPTWALSEVLRNGGSK